MLTSVQTERGFAFGHQIGEIARGEYPDGVLMPDELSEALSQTQVSMRDKAVPIFEATFKHSELLIRADLLRPTPSGWVLTEVKSSTSVKDYQLEDAAVQAWVTEGAGTQLDRIEVSHVDKEFRYRGGGDYRGFLKPVDVTCNVRELLPSVPQWVAAAKDTLAETDAPDIRPGAQCSVPFECPFIGLCNAAPVEDYPVELLPRNQAGNLAKELRVKGYGDLREVPRADIGIKPILLRIHQSTCSGQAYLAPEAKQVVDALPWPRYHIDFETINPGVPIWFGTRPYQQIPFQWSCHVEHRDGALTHSAYLADAADDPRPGFIKSLLQAVGKTGAVLVYNQAFEEGRLKELVRDFPEHADDIQALVARLVDLLQIAREHYYHRDQFGSWSIKAVLPTIAPDLSYHGMTVEHGGMAMEAFYEMLAPETSGERRDELRRGLLDYCKLDTLAMVRIAHHFAQRP